MEDFIHYSKDFNPEDIKEDSLKCLRNDLISSSQQH